MVFHRPKANMSNKVSECQVSQKEGAMYKLRKMTEPRVSYPVLDFEIRTLCEGTKSFHNERRCRL